MPSRANVFAVPVLFTDLEAYAPTMRRNREFKHQT